MHTFLEFVDKKTRDSIHHLKVVKELLEKNGFTVDSYLSRDDDPYIFLHSSDEQLSFEGVRIYQIGDTIAYRVQKENETHPYGKAYMLDVETMFNDLVSDNGDEEKAGNKVISAVVKEFKTFFKTSKEAEYEIKSADFVDQDNDSRDDTNDGGRIVLRNPNTDYGASMMGR